MEPTIKTLAETKLLGKHITMTFANIKTRALWQSFMPHRHEIKNRVGSDFYSIEVYNNPHFFEQFDLDEPFEKWAAVPVSDYTHVPSGMHSIVLPEGLYAVFLYKGKASEAQPMYQYIFADWIPNSPYQLDDRPHFAVMGDKYKHDHPDSEEELWIPIRKLHSNSNIQQ
jgi:AraC family transcriptional regulator